MPMLNHVADTLAGVATFQSPSFRMRCAKPLHLIEHLVKTSGTTSSPSTEDGLGFRRAQGNVHGRRSALGDVDLLAGNSMRLRCARAGRTLLASCFSGPIDFIGDTVLGVVEEDSVSLRR